MPHWLTKCLSDSDPPFFCSGSLTDKMPVKWNQLHPNHLTDKIVCQIFSELALNFELGALLWAFDRHFVCQTPELWALNSELWTLSYEHLTGILSVKWAELWALNSELWARTWALNYAQNLMGYIYTYKKVWLPGLRNLLVSRMKPWLQS